MPNLDAARTVVPLEINLLSLMAIHGLLCLALRHPKITEGTVRSIGLKFIEDAGRMLVRGGLLTEEELEEVHRVEEEEGL